jgi:D-beta-D-heptose 7-phosphate kinase/D-beta-D-heptose 1-phosphate adenosyltransferase
MKVKFDITSKIYSDFAAFEPLLKKWKENNEKIVFTNGCFDLIHLGHVDSLLKAASMGTKLIVGLNSDESVRALKGKGRPILNIKARTTLLAAFAFVDAVIVFSEETPARLIAGILPDLLVKGNEYAINEIAGFDTVIKNGGKVKTLKLVPGVSTTEMINKIKSLD